MGLDFIDVVDWWAFLITINNLEFLAVSGTEEYDLLNS